MIQLKVVQIPCTWEAEAGDSSRPAWSADSQGYSCLKTENNLLKKTKQYGQWMTVAIWTGLHNGSQISFKLTNSSELLNGLSQLETRVYPASTTGRSWVYNPWFLSKCNRYNNLVHREQYVNDPNLSRDLECLGVGSTHFKVLKPSVSETSLCWHTGEIIFSFGLLCASIFLPLATNTS